MTGWIELDVCGLEPPEPMERVLEAISTLERGQAIRMVIDREPRPFYPILQRNGFTHQTTLRPDYLVAPAKSFRGFLT